MKISVCGKGGSGKSSIVALLANNIQKRGYRVVVIDSDESNPGLYRLLGLNGSPAPLLDLVGGKQRVDEATRQGMEILAYAKISAQEKIPLDSIPPKYMVKKGNIGLIIIGKILQSLEGCACPMGALSKEFLKKLQLKENEVAIVDTEAGIEHFGRGVDTSVDGVLVIVEPSFDSIVLAEKINGLAIGAGVDAVWTVLNKTTSDEMTSKLEEELRKRGLDLIGSIHYDPRIFEACMVGNALGEGKAAEEVGRILDSLLLKV
jgi:CO dehydrogenase maturation factor